MAGYYVYNTEKKRSKKKIILLIIIFLLIIISFTGYFVANNIVATKMQERIVAMGLQDLISWNRVSVNILARKITIHKLKIAQGNDYAIADKIAFSNFQQGQPIISSITISVKNLVLPTTEEMLGKYSKTFSPMGYKRLILSGSVSMTYSAAEQLVNISINNVDIAELGKINAATTILNESEKGNMEFVQTIATMPIKAAWIRFEDKGITNNILNYYADTGHIDIRNAKNRILTSINKRIIVDYKNDSSKIRRLAQVYRFMESPHGIMVKLNEGEMMTISKILPNMNIVNDPYTMIAWLVSLPANIIAN